MTQLDEKDREKLEISESSNVIETESMEEIDSQYIVDIKITQGDRTVGKKWTMPIKNWPLALNQFEILCGDFKQDLLEHKF